MASANGIIIGAPVQAPPIVTELQAVFDRLDDAHLLLALIGPTRRGPKGHSIQMLWRCFVAKHYLSLPSTRAMIRTLVNNPWIADVCGILSQEDIPHEATFSRFFAKMAHNRHLHLVKDVSRTLARHHKDTIPGFIEKVALDSTTLKAWSNGGKPRLSDQEAGWSVKKGTNGKTEYTYGYKLHLIVSCGKGELPIAAKVTAGNVSDVKVASSVLSQAQAALHQGFRPRYIMADAGYSSKDFFYLVQEPYGAEPIIMVNRGHKKLVERFGIWEKTATWKALYSQRQAVERAFSRLKGQRSLNHITTRGLMKVTLHCYLALIAMQASQP